MGLIGKDAERKIGARWRTCAGALALGAAAGAALLAGGGCATRGDMETAIQTNQVQDRRLGAIEESAGRELKRLTEELQKTREQLSETKELLDEARKTLGETRGQVEQSGQELGATGGRLFNLSRKVDQLLEEQAAMAEKLDRSLAQSRAAQAKLAKIEQDNATFRTEQKRELDGLHLVVRDLEGLLKSNVANLPSKTKADRLFREATFNLVNGQLDIAADQFRQFAETFPNDERVAEAKFRMGQAFFLQRKYDHAIVPYFELVDKFAGHKLAPDARWMLARSLEETGDLKLAREFYAQLIADNSVHKADATRRVHFITALYPNLNNDAGKAGQGKR